MSEEFKNIHEHEHDCDCDCGCHDHDEGCDCGCEDDIVMLQDENGNDVAFHFVTTLEHEGKTYVYLQGDDENDEDDAMVIEIFELESEEDGDEAYDRLYPVDDDLYEVLYNKLLEEVQKQAELGDEDACEGCEEESCDGCPLDDGKAE